MENSPTGISYCSSSSSNLLLLPAALAAAIVVSTAAEYLLLSLLFFDPPLVNGLLLLLLSVASSPFEFDTDFDSSLDVDVTAVTSTATAAAATAAASADAAFAYSFSSVDVLRITVVFWYEGSLSLPDNWRSKPLPVAALWLLSSCDDSIDGGVFVSPPSDEDNDCGCNFGDDGELDGVAAESHTVRKHKKKKRKTISRTCFRGFV